MLRASGQPPDVRAGDNFGHDEVVVFAGVLDVVACVVETSRPGGKPRNLISTPVIAINRQRRAVLQRTEGQVERRRAEDI